MKKAYIFIGVAVFVCLVLAAVLVTVYLKHNQNNAQETWKDMGFDLSLPTLGEDGWYMVFEDDFEGDALNQNIRFGENYTGQKEIWTTSPHAIRWESNDESKPQQACWWCPEMVEVKDSNVIIHARYEDSHTCSGDCPAAGRFTGGIETRRITGDNNQNKGSEDELLFAQVFYLCEVLVSQARVQINDKIGIGLIKGDDLDKAYYLAVIDAAYQNKKDLSAFDDALRKQQHLQQLKAKINVQNILKTKVSFETMDI